jgi:hypothetical protein
MSADTRLAELVRAENILSPGKIPFFDLRKFTVGRVFRSPPANSPNALSDMRSRGGSRRLRNGRCESRGLRPIYSLNCCKPSTTTLTADGEIQHFDLTVTALNTEDASTATASGSIHVDVTPVAEAPTRSVLMRPARRTR